MNIKSFIVKILDKMKRKYLKTKKKEKFKMYVQDEKRLLLSYIANLSDISTTEST